MRRSELALGQTTGNGLPHLRNTHFRETFHRSGRACAAAHEGFDVALHDSSSFTRSGNQAQAQSTFFGQTLGQWRGLHPAIRHGGGGSRCGLCCWSRRCRRGRGRCRCRCRSGCSCWSRCWSRCRSSWSFLGRGFRLCRREQIGDVLAFFAQDAKHAVHRCGASFLHTNVKQDTVLEGLKLHGGFVGFDFSEQFAALHLIANLFVPLSDDPFGHGVAQLGHANDFSHVSRSQRGNQIACRRPRRAQKRQEAGFPPRT